MSTSTHTDAMESRFNSASSPGELAQLLAEIRHLSRDHPDAKSLGAIEARCFDRVRRATAQTPDAGASVLLAELLPRSLEHVVETTDDPWPHYGELLSEWLGQLPVEGLAVVRQNALAAAKAALDAGNIPGGLRVIARIGFADPEICTRLDSLYSDQDDELGDRALAVRVNLGVAPDARGRIMESLHHRLRQRLSPRLLSIAKRIGTADTASILLESWANLPTDGGRQSIDDLFVPGAVVAIASRCDDAQGAVDLWNLLRTRAEAFPDRHLLRALDMSVIAKFPVPDVVPDLLARLPGVKGASRWGTYSRLKECIQPVHSAGWDRVPATPLEAVREDAEEEVTVKGRFVTSELRQKEDAWSVLLSVGRLETLASADRAIRGDVNGYVKHTFLDLYACLGIPPLPTDVPGLLSGPAPDPKWAQDEFLIAQVGAVRAAHAAMTQEAFEALTRYRPARDGILLSVIEALAELAKSGAEMGRRTRITALLALTEAPEPTARSAAGAALAELLERGVLNADEVVRLAPHASAAETDPYTRRALFQAFAARREATAPPELLKYAADLTTAARPLTDDERKAGLGVAALTLLASRLSEADEVCFLPQHLGLNLVDGRVCLFDETAAPPVTYALVSGWYASQPERYAPAFASLLRTADARRLAPLLTTIRRSGAHNVQEVVVGLLQRIHGMDDGLAAEPDAIAALADVAPDRLLTEEWALLDRWMPQARIAFADVLSRLALPTPELEIPRVAILIRMAGDGLYGVRRAAYRAYSKVAPDGFAALLAGWSEVGGDEGLELRRRAAEGTVWINSANTLERFQKLGWDPDATVREAYERAGEDRQEKSWREYHEAKVLVATTREDVVRYWRHGHALGKLGDDQTIDLLLGRSGASLPPNVRFWLDRVRKAVQGHWDEVVSKWPEPSFTRRGRYEVVDGRIRWADGTEAEIRAHLWQSLERNGHYSWGGWAHPNLSASEMWKRAFANISPGEDELRVSGRNPVPILITRSSLPGGQLVFSGAGHYPGHSDE
jgi:hypothetical protein